MSTWGRFSTIFGLGLCLATVGLLMRQAGFILLALPAFVYAIALLVSYLLLPSVRLRVDRSHDVVRIPEGSPLEMTLTCSHDARSKAIVSVLDLLPSGVELVDGETAYLGPLAADEAVPVTATVEGRRGVHQLDGVRASVWSRFGLAERNIDVDAPLTLRCLPRVERLTTLPIRPRRTRAFAGPVKSRLGGLGIDFFGGRAYYPGDDVRRINWRAYALRDELTIVEFEQERITDVNLILDARARVHTQVGDTSTFEHACRATVSLAGHFIDQGNSVGLLIYGDCLNWIFPALGRVQFERIRDAVSEAQIADKEAFEDLRQIPTRLFTPRSQMVMVSPLADETDVETLALLCGRGYSLLLVCPDSLPLEQAALPRTPSNLLAARILRLERTIFLESLVRMGVRLIDWDLDSPLEESAEQVRHRRGGRGR